MTIDHSIIPPDLDVEIRPEVTMLSVLRHLNYEPWFALAEFVDNAIQSFLVSQKVLKSLHGSDFRLEVKIDLDSNGPGLIVITDNAAGISTAEYNRAFKPAHVPPDRSGLSEFGMGMKSAACWFSARWSVRTKALGEAFERSIEFDLSKIIDENLQTLQPATLPADLNRHYTVITLRDLHHVPRGRTVGKIKDHLASIYRVYLRDGTLRLKLNGEYLSHENPAILKAARYSSPGVPIEGDDHIAEWKKEINLDFGAGQKVTGFVALREKASTALAGFALFRRNRLIEGSHDATYRPSKIFKHTNSYQYQRIFGELHLDGFDVSHTKDGFRWEEAEDEFLDLLSEVIDSDPLNLSAQAENFRALPTRRSLQDNANVATENVAIHIETVIAPIVSESRNNPQAFDELPTEIPANELQASERTVQINDGGYTWIITLRTSIDPSVENWLSLSKDDAHDGEDISRVRRIIIDLSLAHPFCLKYLGPTSDNIEVLLQFATGLSISLMLAEDLTGEAPQTVLHFLNDVLRGNLVKETIR